MTSTPSILRAASGAVLLLVAVGCLALGLVLLRALDGSASGLVTALPWLVFVAGAASLAAFRLSEDARLALALTMLSTFAALLLAEAVLTLTAREGFVSEVAGAAGVQHDRRSRAEVVRDLRAQGVNAWPAFHGWVIREGGEGGRRLAIPGPSGPIVPLTTGLAGATVVFCNESGPYETYRADERGFNNPAGSWNLAPLDLVAVGDSYAQGFCVPPDSGIVPRLRGTWPRALNLAISGTGPLIQLAVLREFLPITRPRDVLWFYYEGNDLADLELEARQTSLRRYLADSAFRQNLPELQLAVERGLAAFLDERMADALARDVAVAPRGPSREGTGIVSVLKFTRLRALAGIGMALPPPPERLEIFRTVLSAAQRDVARSGGRLHFVYLPAYDRYARGILRTDAERAQVMRVVKALGLPTIDVHQAFEATGDPRSLWVHPQGHYNGKGYGVVADAVRDAMSVFTAETR